MSLGFRNFLNDRSVYDNQESYGHDQRNDLRNGERPPYCVKSADGSLLDKQIQVDVKELEQLREMRGTIQGCSYGEKIGTNPNRNLEAPFIKTIEKIWDYEQRIDAQINRLIDLRSEINAAIESMENPEERLLLKYRYLKNESWEDISYDLNVSYRTVHRIHASALNNFVVPE